MSMLLLTAASCDHQLRPTRIFSAFSRARADITAAARPPLFVKFQLTTVYSGATKRKSGFSGDCSTLEPLSFRNRNTPTLSPKRHTQITHTQWHRLGETRNIKFLLLMAGIERNPGPSTKQHITLSHININSITATNKLQELEQFISTNSIDILALTETKLDDTVHPSLYSLSHFHPPLTRHRTRRGGGTALYARSTLPLIRLNDLELEGEEWIWAMVRTKNCSIIFCVTYLPPDLPNAKQQDFIDRLTEGVTLAQAYNPTCIFLTGDFNTGNIYLPSQTVNRNSGTTPFDYRLEDTAQTLDLKQLITSPTRIDENVHNLRDLIFVNNTAIIQESGTLSPFLSLDHFPIYVKFEFQSNPLNKPQYKEIFDFKNMDIDRLTNILMQTDWHAVLDNDVDEAVRQFTAALTEAAKMAIPIKRIPTGRDDKPWITSELMREIRKRDRLFRHAKRKQTESDWRRWRVQRNIVTNINKKLRDRHFKNKVEVLLRHKHSPHKYHLILKSMIGQNRDKVTPPLIGRDGTLLADDKHKAEFLNEHFAKQSRLDIDDSRNPMNDATLPTHTLQTINRMFATEREVLALLNSLNPNESCGPDKLPSRLLSLTAILIYEPLTKLFNLSLSQGIYPSKWKEAVVQPIFKNKGSSSDVNNYRPISLLPSLSKIFEKIVFDRVYKHITTHSLLTERQSGYRPGHNTQMQLVHLTHSLYESLDRGMDYTVIYLDISKYFDKIWHKGLLKKCEIEFGISGTLLKWLGSYLDCRTQRVRVNNALSSTKTLNAGCPQGSVLGPLLAILYLNKLADTTNNDILLFADDTSLHKSHVENNPRATQNLLQADLDAIYNYGNQWAITFNAAKTIQQTFSFRTEAAVQTTPHLTFGGLPIPVATAHKHLGLTFSSDLKFHCHINEVIKRVNRAVSPLYPIAKYLSRQTLIQIYTTYISPIFDYCDVIYDGLITLHDSYRLEKTQNRIARLITGTPLRTSTDKLRRDLGWTSLSDRRKLHKLSLYHKLGHDTRIPQYITATLPNTRANDTGRTLRNSTQHTLPYNRTSSFQRSFIPATTRLWNNLPKQTRVLPHGRFKRAVLRQLGPSRPPKYFNLRTKFGNILYTKLRVGISDLNSHLFQIQKSATTSCACGHNQENTQHFVLQCPKYQNLRHTLFQNLSGILQINFTNISRSRQLDILLHGAGLAEGTDGAVGRFFQKFLIHSGRFA